MSKNAVNPIAPNSPEAWVLHRLLGHHPTSPNLRDSEITAKTPNLEQEIRTMLGHSTYRDRINSLSDNHHYLAVAVNTLVERAVAIVQGHAICPYKGCGLPYIPRVTTLEELQGRVAAVERDLRHFQERENREFTQLWDGMEKLEIDHNITKELVQELKAWKKAVEGKE